MAKVFVSFDYDVDKHYKYLLNAWNANLSIPFSFDDRSATEIQSNDVYVVKNVLSRKINESSAVIVIIGKDANKDHPDRQKIGYRNWQNYEIATAKRLGKKLIAVQIQQWFQYPEQLLGANAIRVQSFTLDAITKAIRGY